MATMGIVVKSRVVDGKVRQKLWQMNCKNYGNRIWGGNLDETIKSCFIRFKK